MPHVLCSVLHRKLFYSTPDRCRLPLQSTRAASAIAARRCGPTACRSWCTSKGRLGSPRPPCPSPSTTWTRPTALWAMSSMTGWSSHGRSACSLTRQWFSPDAACTEVQASQGVPASLHSLRQGQPQRCRACAAASNSRAGIAGTKAKQQAFEQRASTLFWLNILLLDSKT